MNEKKNKFRQKRNLIVRIGLLVFFIAIFWFLSITVNPSDLSIRLIVTAVGIDKQDDMVKLSCQVYMPDIDDKKTAKLTVIEAEDTTITKAIDLISRKTGKVPSFNQCALIIFGEDALEDYVYDLEYFFLSNKIRGSCSVMSCQKANDMIKIMGEFDKISAVTMENYITYNESTLHGIRITVINLLENARSESASALMPYIELEEIEEQQSSGQGGQSGADDSTSSGSNEGQKLHIKEIDKLLVLSDKKKVGMLDFDQTIGFVLAQSENTSGLIDLGELTVEGNSSKNTAIMITRKKQRQRLVLQEGKLVLEIKLKIRAALELFEGISAMALDSKGVEAIEKAAAQRLQQIVEQNIQAALAKSKELDTDILQLKSLAFRYYPNEYPLLKDILQNAQIKTDITVNISYV